jgi:hypothetical protein
LIFVNSKDSSTLRFEGVERDPEAAELEAAASEEVADAVADVVDDISLSYWMMGVIYKSKGVCRPGRSIHYERQFLNSLR